MPGYLALLVLLVVEVPAGPPAPPPAQDVAGAAASDAGADRKRLLHLEDGSILRARSRQVDGAWQVRSGREWLPLEAEVGRVVLERDALARARALTGKLSRGDHGRRLVAARWMVTAGLYPEAIEELDKILRLEPGHAATLGYLATSDIPVELPGSPRPGTGDYVTALLKAGAQRRYAAREVCVQHVAELADSLDLERLVRRELVTSQPTRRAFATYLARRLYPGALLRALLDRAILDGFRSVRSSAVEGLRESGEISVLGPVLRALDSGYPNVRTNAIEALGNLGHAAAVEPLVAHLAALQGGGGGVTGTRANLFVGGQVAYVMDYDVEIAQAASIADPVVAVQSRGVALDVRTTVQLTEIVERRAVVTALQSLTGTRNASGRAWLDWWESNQEAWRSADLIREHLARRSGDR